MVLGVVDGLDVQAWDCVVGLFEGIEVSFYFAAFHE